MRASRGHSTGSAACIKVADLRGGYGTTGMRVVFSVPFDEVGLGLRGRLRNVEVFSALETYATGPQIILDRLRLK